MFVLQSKSDANSEPKPRTQWSAVDDLDEQVGAASPEQRFVNIERIEIPNAEINERAKRGHAAQRRRQGAAAKLARKSAGERNDKRPGAPDELTATACGRTRGRGAPRA